MVLTIPQTSSNCRFFGTVKTVPYGEFCIVLGGTEYYTAARLSFMVMLFCSMAI